MLFVVGVVASGRLSSRLSLDFSLPGQPGYETAKQVEDLYGSNTAYLPPTIVVASDPEGPITADRDRSLTLSRRCARPRPELASWTSPTPATRCS